MGLLGQNFHSRITGSAFADTAANTIIAPQGQAIIAIQAIGTTDEEILIGSLVAVDATKDFNTVSAAGSTGRFTRKVNGAVSSASKIIFDEENSANGGIKPGDEIYLTTGGLVGTVAALNPDGNNTKEISTNATLSLNDDVVVSFIRPGESGGVGAGGQTFANNNKIPAGITIYGAWKSVSLQGDALTGGLIAYFGQI